MTRVTRRPIITLIGAVMLLVAARIAFADVSATVPADSMMSPPAEAVAPVAVEPPVSAPVIAPVSPPVAVPSTPVSDLPEIVVTGARSPRPRRTTPDTVSVVSKESLDGRNVTDLAGAIEQVPGADVVRYGAPGSVAAVFLRGARGSQSVVMQDGRPINAVGSGDADLARVPVGAIERVEVVRGAAALLHGSGALGGVVNVVTPRPPSESSGSVEARGGSFGSRWLHADAGGALGPVRWLLGGDETATDGHRRNSQGRGTNAIVKLEAFENPVLSIGFTAGDAKTGTPGTRPPADPGARSESQKQFGDGEISSLIDGQRDARRAFDSGVTYVPWVGHAFIARSYIEVTNLDFTYGWVPYDSMNFVYLPKRIDTTHTRAYTQGEELQYQGGPFLLEDIRVTLGTTLRAEQLWNTQDSYDTGGGDGTLGTERIHALIGQRSVYLSTSLKPLARISELTGVGGFDRLTISLGGRSDNHSQFGAIRNGHAGATLDVGAALLKASAGTAFRAPAINDLFWPATVYDRGNPDLQPERGRSVEWGVERTREGLFVRVGGFVRTVRDQIDWAPDAAGVWSPTNIGYVRARGTEAEGSVTRGRFTLAGSLTAIDAMQRQTEVSEVMYDFVSGVDVPVRYEKREHRVSHTPRFISAGTFSMRLKRGTTAAVSVRHVGDRLLHTVDYTNYPVLGTAVKRLPPVTLLGLRVSRPLGQDTEAYAGVDNLTDRQYSDRFGGVKDRDYPMPGRTFYAGARVSW